MLFAELISDIKLDNGLHCSLFDKDIFELQCLIITETGLYNFENFVDCCDDCPDSDICLDERDCNYLFRFFQVGNGDAEVRGGDPLTF